MKILKYMLTISFLEQALSNLARKSTIIILIIL